jgi:gamma-glutamylcyclotransferase (GGCT)/AIG2-like uncharacterized protein YtfP
MKIEQVIVYGTLKKGFNNHHLLQTSEFLGTQTLFDITLYDLDYFPAALAEPSDGVEVELYTICSEVLKDLDILEGYDSKNPEQGLYRRCRWQTSLGASWIYLYNHSVKGARAIKKGCWSHNF